MRDRDHRLRAFGDRLSFEVDQSVLGDDEHHVAAWRGHDVAGGQLRNDSASTDIAAFVGRRHADERLSAVRGVAGADELELTSGTGDVTVSARLARRLALQ